MSYEELFHAQLAKALARLCPDVPTPLLDVDEVAVRVLAMCRPVEAYVETLDWQSLLSIASQMPLPSGADVWLDRLLVLPEADKEYAAKFLRWLYHFSKEYTGEATDKDGN